MADLALIALVLVFFALTRGYVAACARLIGERSVSEGGNGDRRAEERRPGSDGATPLAALAPLPLAAASAENWVALTVAVVLIAYLVLALLRPERF